MPLQTVNADLHGRRCAGEEEECTQISARKRDLFNERERQPVPPPSQEFLVSHFYWSQAEDAPCLEPPRRTQGRLGAALPGGAEHSRP